VAGSIPSSRPDLEQLPIDELAGCGGVDGLGVLEAMFCVVGGQRGGSGGEDDQGE
jgi:hypothetical protein